MGCRFKNLWVENMATIYEVSELAGVSLATVSRVMNESGRVSAKTRQKVLSAMAALNYRPNSIAQSLASRRSNCVGVLVSELRGPIFGAMVSAIEEELTQYGKTAIFAVGHSDKAREKAGIEFLASRNCDALILHVEAMTDQDLVDQAVGTTPYVVINRNIKGLEKRCISLNNERGGYEATKLLLEMGHRNIAYISGPLSWGDASARFAGHQGALAESGIHFDEQLMIEGDYHETGGSGAMERLFREGREFSAVVCANDEMASGAMDVIHTRGLSIPDDISVVGFDNVRWACFLYPKLTTINNPVHEMGQMSARWVLKNVYEENGLEIQNVFEPTRVHRASAGPAKIESTHAASEYTG